MMKFLGLALVVLVCISVTFVDGRKDKRGRKEHHGRLEARRADHKRMREAQQTEKGNVGEPTHDATSKQVKVTQESSNDAKAHLAKKEKRGHKKHEAHDIEREDKFKRSHARHPHHKEDFHKRHHGKRPHHNDVRMMKKQGKMSREMLLENDLPIDVHRKMMKMAKKEANHHERMNHSRKQRRKDNA